MLFRSKMSRKVIILGDSGVGKTSILNCYRNGCMVTDALPVTTAIDFLVKEETCNDWRIMVKSC